MEDFMHTFADMELRKCHPILTAAYLHDELVRIHPFIDGNGRTSRLLMNLYLLRNGFTIVNLKGDNDSKLHYYSALETSHTQNRPEAFQAVVAAAEVESLKRHMAIFGGATEQ